MRGYGILTCWCSFFKLNKKLKLIIPEITNLDFMFLDSFLFIVQSNTCSSQCCGAVTSCFGSDSDIKKSDSCYC